MSRRNCQIDFQSICNILYSSQQYRNEGLSFLASGSPFAVLCIPDDDHSDQGGAETESGFQLNFPYHTVILSVLILCKLCPGNRRSDEFTFATDKTKDIAKEWEGGERSLIFFF